MKNLLITTVIALMFIGCSKDEMPTTMSEDDLIDFAMQDTWYIHTNTKTPDCDGISSIDMSIQFGGDGSTVLYDRCSGFLPINVYFNTTDNTIKFRTSKHEYYTASIEGTWTISHTIENDLGVKHMDLKQGIDVMSWSTSVSINPGH